MKWPTTFAPNWLILKHVCSSLANQNHWHNQDMINVPLGGELILNLDWLLKYRDIKYYKQGSEIKKKK